MILFYWKYIQFKEWHDFLWISASFALSLCFVCILNHLKTRLHFSWHTKFSTHMNKSKSCAQNLIFPAYNRPIHVLPVRWISLMLFIKSSAIGWPQLDHSNIFSEIFITSWTFVHFYNHSPRLLATRNSVPRLTVTLAFDVWSSGLFCG